MKWIKRKLRQWVNEAEYDEDYGAGGIKAVSIDQTNRIDSNPVLHFRIFSAQNGLVLEFNSYCDKTDQRSHSTYIINHGEDVAEFVRQTLPMEMLKHNAPHG